MHHHHATWLIRLILSSIATLTLVMGGLVLPAQAHPDGVTATPNGGFAGTTVTKYTMIKRSKVTDFVDRRKRLATCSAGNNNTTCTIASGESATRTFQAAFGLKNSWVANQLSISSSSTVTVTVGCSKRIKKNRKLVAYSIGSRHRYKIRRKTTSAAGTYVSTSGWKYTFNPYKNGIHCEVIQ